MTTTPPPVPDPEQSRAEEAATDTAMHQDLLGPDLDRPTPPEVREIIAEQARKMGLDPDKLGIR